MAFWNMCGSGCGADFLVAWPTAEMSFVDPEIGANVVFGGKLGAPDQCFASEETSAQWKEMVERMVEDASPYGAAGHYYIQDVIDPQGDPRVFD